MRKTVHSRPYKELIAQLVIARKEAGYSQEKLAKVLKRPQSFVAKTENGERRLDVVELLQIAKALNTDAADIIASVARLI